MYQSAFKATDVTSDKMKKAINDWYELYYNKETSAEEDPCQRIAYTIVRKLTKTAFSECKTVGNGDFIQRIINALNKKRGDAMQKMLIGGECLIKPIPTRDGFTFNVVDRYNVLVFGRDNEGHLTDIGTAETVVRGEFHYTLLERRFVTPEGYLTIQNMLYRSNSENDLGRRVPLNSISEYKDLTDVYTFQKAVGSIGMASLRAPMENCVDGTCDAVSVYAAAAGLIHNINRNEAQINGEFERGESRIIASSDLMSKNKDGKRSFSDHVFVGLDEDPETVGITIFSPSLREQSFLNRKQEYLRNVESVIGLKRGLLSDVEAAERTAKEITSSEGDYNLTIVDFQSAWEHTVREVMRICGILGQMYHISGAHEIAEDNVTFDWGNGVLFDEEKTWADMKDQVARGLLKPEIAVGWRYGMPYETESDLQKIREKYMPGIVVEGEGEF